MINLDVSNYSGAYAHINGSYPLNINRLDLARAMISVGCGSYANIRQKGFWGIVWLFAKAFSNTVDTPAGIVLSNHYKKMSQSEKVSESYYLGQALTTLYAQKIHRIKWLLHFEDCNDSRFRIQRNGYSPKCTVGQSNKGVYGPDLVGIINQTTCFLFESKGSSTGYRRDTMQHALNQLSCVSTFNGNFPEAKVACYFDLSKTPINGIIIDPENNREGRELIMDVPQRMRQYYSLFDEYRAYFQDEITIGQNTYRIAPLGFPGFYFGYDVRYQNLTPEYMPMEDISPNVGDNEYIGKFSNISIGTDGLIVLREEFRRNHYFMR